MQRSRWVAYGVFATASRRQVQITDRVGAQTAEHQTPKHRAFERGSICNQSSCLANNLLAALREKFATEKSSAQRNQQVEIGPRIA